MRIISKFQDYYDGIQVHDEDRSLVFVRLTQAFEDETPEAKPFADFVNFAAQAFPGEIPHKRPHNHYAAVRPGLLLLAGKLVPYARFVPMSPVYNSVNLTHYDTEQTRLCLKLEHLAKALDSSGLELPEPRRRASWMTRTPASWEAFFGLRDDPRWLAWATENRHAILRVERNEHRGLQVEVNPSLSRLQLYQEFAPWQVYQELSMFLGNLANPDNTPVTISDKDRIAQHGFDEYSFRKAPSR